MPSWLHLRWPITYLIWYWLYFMSTAAELDEELTELKKTLPS